MGSLFGFIKTGEKINPMQKEIRLLPNKGVAKKTKKSQIKIFLCKYLLFISTNAELKYNLNLS